MTKRLLICVSAFACVLFFAFAFVGCGEKDAATENESTWKYEYAGVEHPYLEAISDYLVQYNAENLEQKDGMIPCITAIEVDNDDSADIKLWGIFDIYNYTLQDERSWKKTARGFWEGSI